MKLRSMALMCFWMATATVAAAGQQRAGASNEAVQAPTSRTLERTYPAGNLTPSRETRTSVASGNREVVTETIEQPDLDGRLKGIVETRMETVRTAPNSTRSRKDIFDVDSRRQRILVERTESEHEASMAGNSRLTETTWTADLDGRLNVKSRWIEETSSRGPNVHDSTTTLHLPDTNGTLRESERTESSERAIGSSVVRDSTYLIRDLNGQWQATEMRVRNARPLGSSVQLEDETVLRRDINGHLAVSERTTVSRSRTNGREDVLTEIYAPNADGLVRPDSRLALSQRVRTSTIPTADGGSRTVEEVEARNQMAPADPLRLTRRTEVTVRRIGSDRWSTERRVFELDVNGRMVPVLTEAEDSRGK